MKTHQGQPGTIRNVLGVIVGPTIWITSLTLLVYGLWVQAWYGYVLAAIFLTFAVVLWVFLRRVRRFSVRSWNGWWQAGRSRKTKFRKV